MSKIEVFEKLSLQKKETIIQAGISEFAEKTYSEANTERITSACEISKGLLFHYFGSKKNFYLYCLERALESLLGMTEEVTGEDFYEILFATMDAKISKCIEFPLQTKFVNMASRDASKDIAMDKNLLLQKYMSQVHIRSFATLETAISKLQLKNSDGSRVKEGMSIYVSAIMSKYLMLYQDRPEEFFQKADDIKEEFRSYMELMLRGIARE